MYLSDQSGVLEVTFKVKFENGFYTLYASSGSMKCFECADVGHKRSTCLHKEQAMANNGADDQQPDASQASASEQQAVAGRCIAVERGSDVRQCSTGEQPVSEAMQAANDSAACHSLVLPEKVIKTGIGIINIVLANDAPVKGSVVGDDNLAERQIEDLIYEKSIEGANNETLVAKSIVTSSFSSLDVEEENEDVLDDDSSSQYSDIVPHERKQMYTLQEVNDFLDDMYNRPSVDIFS